MADDLLSLITNRLENRPPTISRNELGRSIERLEQLGLLRPAESIASLPCDHCDGSQLLPVVFIRNETTQRNDAYISCGECGSIEVDPRSLDRWRIDPVTFLTGIMRELSTKAKPPREVIPDRLWNAGKFHLAGQLREIFFATGYRAKDGQAIVDFIGNHSKCILLLPSETGVSRWGSASNNLVVAIESFVSLGLPELKVDRRFFESRIASYFGDKKPKAPPKRRASRLSDIESLERELEEHIRAARDFAVNTRDLTGEAKLLPRPTKADLAKRACVSPYDVTRCFQDKLGGNLEMLWNLAGDLDRLAGYRDGC